MKGLLSHLLRLSLLTLVGVPSPALAEAPSLGVMVDAGLPDGLHGALVWRPTPRLRVHGGGGYNGVAPGVRVGLSVAAVPFWITPTVNVEAGRFFGGDANVLVQMIGGDESFDEPVLRDIGYDYANAHLGLELGYQGMTFYLHGGMSVVEMRLRNVGDSLALAFDSEDGPKIEVRSDPTVRLIAPSARTGFVYYF